MHEVGGSRNLMWGQHKLMHEVGVRRNLMWGQRKLMHEVGDSRNSIISMGTTQVT